MSARAKTSSAAGDAAFNVVFEKLHDAVLSVGETDNLADALLQIAVERFGGDHGMLLELEDTTGGLREAATFGTIEEMLSQDMRIFAQYATDHPQDPDSVVIAPVAKDVKKLSARKSIRRDMALEVLIFPLVSNDLAVGALYLGSKKQGTLKIKEMTPEQVLLVGNTLGEILGLDRNMKRLSSQNKALQRQVQKETTYENLIGTSEGIERIKRALDLVVDTDIPITLLGEKGTGKSLIASIVHSHSARKDKPFIVFQGDEIPEPLISGALFGQTSKVRGAPHRGRRGALLDAKGGTLFIKHVEKLPLSVQSQLVVALERGEMLPIGGDREYLVDVRLVVSTEQNIKQLYEEKQIKPDLYKLMVQFPVIVPPLRDRVEDLAQLVPHFAEQAAAAFGKTISGISTEVYDYLGSHEWPGNVEELEKEIRQAVLLTPDRSGQLSAASLNPQLVARPQPVLEEPGEGTLKQRIARIEKKMIMEALERFSHNQSITADTLGLSRQALINKLHRYGIETGRKYKRKMREIAKKAEEAE